MDVHDTSADDYFKIENSQEVDHSITVNVSEFESGNISTMEDNHEIDVKDKPNIHVTPSEADAHNYFLNKSNEPFTDGELIIDEDSECDKKATKLTLFEEKKTEILDEFSDVFNEATLSIEDNEN